MPLFEVTFADPDLKRRAEEMCQGDFYCLFDIAATGDVSFGMTTLIGGQVLDTIANISQPGKTTYVYNILYLNTLLTYTYNIILSLHMQYPVIHLVKMELV